MRERCKILQVEKLNLKTFFTFKVFESFNFIYNFSIIRNFQPEQLNHFDRKLNQSVIQNEIYFITKKFSD